MGIYKFVEHTADEKFIVQAKDLDDAFATCVDAFCEVMVPGVVIANNVSKTIHVQAKRLRSLLYDFLNELVFYYDDEDLILRNVVELHIKKTDEGWELDAEVTGDKHYEYEVEMEIKNMTYSDMEITGRGTGKGDQTSDVSITVVVDI